VKIAISRMNLHSPECLLEETSDMLELATVSEIAGRLALSVDAFKHFPHGCHIYTEAQGIQTVAGEKFAQILVSLSRSKDCELELQEQIKLLCQELAAILEPGTDPFMVELRTGDGPYEIISLGRSQTLHLTSQPLEQARNVLNARGGWFTAAFGAPLPKVDGRNVRLKQVEETWWSSVGAEKWLTSEHMIACDSEIYKWSVCDGVMTGFWGHGLNSHAYYWITSLGARHRYLRLPYGGVYSDDQEDRANVLKVLQLLADIDELARGHIVSEHLENVMGSQTWWIRFANQCVLKVYKSGDMVVKRQGEVLFKWPKSDVIEAVQFALSQ